MTDAPRIDDVNPNRAGFTVDLRDTDEVRPAFVVRRERSFWCDLRGLRPRWDATIDGFNHQTGAAPRA